MKWCIQLTSQIKESLFPPGVAATLTEMEEADIHSAQKIDCSDVFPLFLQQVRESRFRKRTSKTEKSVDTDPKGLIFTANAHSKSQRITR